MSEAGAPAKGVEVEVGYYGEFEIILRADNAIVITRSSKLEKAVDAAEKYYDFIEKAINELNVEINVTTRNIAEATNRLCNITKNVKANVKKLFEYYLSEKKNENTKISWYYDDIYEVRKSFSYGVDVDITVIVSINKNALIKAIEEMLRCGAKLQTINVRDYLKPGTDGE